MKKIAVFVEGQTELIIARELILRKYDWNVSIDCLAFVGNNEVDAPYKYSSLAPKFHYQIYNVGNDKRVLKMILKNAQRLLNVGFERIVGLRDMYSKEYREKTITVDQTENVKFKEGANKEIERRGFDLSTVLFCYAIMETEAWFLGMAQVLEKINSTLTIPFIESNSIYKLTSTDPETAFFNPARDLNEIYALVGLKYNKKESEIEALANAVTITDYEALYNHTKCPSFNIFYDSLFPN